ncbi:MAG: spore coat associated protein CotJA [Porcipelethomonas sp.]
MDFSMFERIDNMNNMHEDSVKKPFPKDTPLAMAYVPFQQWGRTYDVEKGFERGTVFPELDFPFDPEEGCL